MDAPDYLRLVLDPVRLAVLGRAATGPVDTAGLAGELGASERRVRAAVGKLRAAGLLTDELRLDVATLAAIGSSLPQFEPAAGTVTDGPWSADEVDVMRRFFEGSRLRSIPTQVAKRRVVLERLAMEFEPGLRYSERDVNLVLQTFHDDYVTLRRYMVDEGMLTRADGVYWRSGGRVEAG